MRSVSQSPVKSPYPLAQTPPPLLSPMKHVPKRTVDEDLTSALRSDVLRLQRLLDLQQNRDALNIEMRKTEAELLRITHLPHHEQMASLLVQLKSRIQDMVRLSGNRARSVSGSELSIVSGLIDLPPPPIPAAELAERQNSLHHTRESTNDRAEEEAAREDQKELAEGSLRGLGSSTYSQVKPISADSLSQLHELGIQFSPDSALDLDSLVRRILTLARGVNKAKTQLGQKVRGVVDVGVQRQQQLLLEADALRTRLSEREREIADMKHQLSSSRYAFNAPRALTTVHDAPMSFEVERQYQKELHRASARVKELEKDYEALHQAGIDDRDSVKQLTEETRLLREEIARMKRDISRVESEKAENRALYLGVSQTRDKEVRMSNSAVKQLENRVESLDERLKLKTQEADNLRQNLAVAVAMWRSADEEIKKLTFNYRLVSKEFEEYQQIYDDDLAQVLEKTQTELLRVWTLADEREGQIAIQRQMLDDVDALKNISNNEAQQFMERLKASTEWKLLTVKAPEETKQLAVRLMMLTGDKEKREGAMAASQTERLNIFRSRAEREVRVRLDRHTSEVNQIRAKDLRSNYDRRSRDVKEALQADEEERKRAEKLTYETISSDYVVESAKRVVEFRTYYDERLDALIEAEMHSLP